MRGRGEQWRKRNQGKPLFNFALDVGRQLLPQVIQLSYFSAPACRKTAEKGVSLERKSLIIIDNILYFIVIITYRGLYRLSRIRYLIL